MIILRWRFAAAWRHYQAYGARLNRPAKSRKPGFVQSRPRAGVR